MYLAILPHPSLLYSPTNTRAARPQSDQLNIMAAVVCCVLCVLSVLCVLCMRQYGVYRQCAQGCSPQAAAKARCPRLQPTGVAMTSLDSLPPQVIKKVTSFVCRIDITVWSQGRDAVRWIDYCWWPEDRLMIFLLVSRNFRRHLAPPPRPEHCNRPDRRRRILPEEEFPHIDIVTVD